MEKIHDERIEDVNFLRSIKKENLKTVSLGSNKLLKQRHYPAQQNGECCMIFLRIRVSKNDQRV